jgi:hypothetical protein
MKNGPSGSADSKPDRLIMGTFAGAVDYCCAKEIRENLMGVTDHQQEVIPKFLTGFGYSESDPEWVEMTPDTVTVRKVNPAPSTDAFTFTLTGSVMRRSSLQFALPRGGKSDITVSVVDMRGSLVRELRSRAGTATLKWDGRASNGRSVIAGTYVVNVKAGSFRTAQKLTVVR